MIKNDKRVAEYYQETNTVTGSAKYTMISNITETIYLEKMSVKHVPRKTSELQYTEHII